jgi:predicted nucleic acid-binding protein
VSTRVVCDASALVALLLDAGEYGKWVTAALDDAVLSAPTLVGFETANIIRRHELAGPRPAVDTMHCSPNRLRDRPQVLVGLAA